MVDDAVQVPDGGAGGNRVGEGGAVGDGPVAGLGLGVVQDAVIVGGDHELAAQLPDGFRGSEAGFVGLGEVEVELAFEEGVPVGAEPVAGGFGGGEVVVVFELAGDAIGFFLVLVGAQALDRPSQEFGPTGEERLAAGVRDRARDADTDEGDDFALSEFVDEAMGEGGHLDIVYLARG